MLKNCYQVLRPVSNQAKQNHAVFLSAPAAVLPVPADTNIDLRKNFKLISPNLSGIISKKGYVACPVKKIVKKNKVFTSIPGENMNDSLLEKARQKITDPKLLSIIASRRARQLARGARPMLKTTEKEYLDIALQEIAEGLIVVEM